MEKSNLELFREALFEAMSSKANEADLAEKIEPSDRHKATMQAILDGTYERKSVWKLTKAKIAAIIVAAALLLAGCAYRNEIRDFIEKFYDNCIVVMFSDKANEGKMIEEVYELSYVPEGYVLEDTIADPTNIRYEYRNSNGSFIRFSQIILDGYTYAFDNESGSYEYITIENIKVYHHNSDVFHLYLWNDGSYAYELRSNVPIPTEELILIINGITKK